MTREDVAKLLEAFESAVANRAMCPGYPDCTKEHDVGPQREAVLAALASAPAPVESAPPRRNCRRVSGSPPCAICGKPASCFGRYEVSSGPGSYACDDCCGHGNEDGTCLPLPVESAPPGGSTLMRPWDMKVGECVHGNNFVSCWECRAPASPPAEPSCARCGLGSDVHPVRKIFLGPPPQEIVCREYAPPAEPGTCPDPNAEYERKADAFRASTGYLAPGKDVPAAARYTEEQEDERQRLWKRFRVGTGRRDTGGGDASSR